MGRVLTGYAAGLGLLTLAGLLLNFEALASHTTSQFNLFLILLEAYTPLLTPLSSATGSPMIGGGRPLGILPLLAWILTSCILGFLLESGEKAAKVSFLASASILIIWIGSLFLSAPAWPDHHTWLSNLNKLSGDLISRPVDLSLILVGPLLISAVIGQLSEELRSKALERDLEERYRLY